MKRIWIVGAIVIIFAGLWIARHRSRPSSHEKENPVTVMETKSYWTCPMHPQIHSEHPGECPICHMKLIPGKSNHQENAKDVDETRAPVQATSGQLALTGTQKTEVEKMNLKVMIPVSGRFTSSSLVAFQIYESDLRYVKPGLIFKGASSFYPEDEISGTIASVDSIVDPTSRTVRVVGSVKNGPRSIPSETAFSGNFELALKDRVAIPESSVLHTGSGDLVYVFTNGNDLSPRKVKLGLKSEGFYDVLEGVSPGEFISSGPNFLIDSESKIRAISSPQEESSGGTGKTTKPACPKGQHWDIPMSMCMPGEH